MRDIRFRAWDNDNKEWCNDFCIELSSGKLLCDHGTTMYVQEIILMQFTGLCDKDGKEIYEGDILQCDEEHGGQIEWVEWSEEELAWVCENGIDNGSWLSGCDGVVVIIGSIHENPELMEQAR